MDLVALPGLEPGLFALRGRRVNQLHHNARIIHPQEVILSSSVFNYIPKTEDRKNCMALKAELLDLVVVVLAIEDVPLL